VAPIPDPGNSYFVPQSGPVGLPAEGQQAYKYFRQCPNNDGGSVLPTTQSPRIKVVLRDAANQPLPGVTADDVLVLLNGGTPAQSLIGDGADSVIASAAMNPTEGCPDLRYLTADSTTDAVGTTYVTFSGHSSPGHGLEDPSRKWGHYDSELPIYARTVRLSGRETTASANGTYVLRIKSMDWTGGLGTTLNQGETVTITDFNGVANMLGVNNAISYWKDFNSENGVDGVDLNIITRHVNHNCETPDAP